MLHEWTNCPNCKSSNIFLMLFFYRCKNCGNLWKKTWSGDENDFNDDFYQGSEKPEPGCQHCGFDREQIIFDDDNDRYYCQTCGSILE